VVYITLTKGSGRAILWGFLKQINHIFDLKIKFHNTNLIATFPNGSVLSLVGAENKGEIDKVRGQGYDLVVVDECKSFPTAVFQELLEEAIEPALMDRLGKLVLIGTPGAILSGPFFEVTELNIGSKSRLWSKRKSWGRRPYKYSVHKWGLDDAALPHIKAEAYSIKESNNWADDHPAWLREYMGQWVASLDALVYAYERHRDGRNTWVPDYENGNVHGLDKNKEWSYVLGIDLGFEDDFAIEVAAYSQHDPNMYQVYDFKSPHLTVKKMAKEINRAKEMFGSFDVMIGDQGGLGKTILATLEEEYGLSIIPAEKKEKLDHIELLNGDLLEGRCKIQKDSLLAQEMEVLQFDATGIKEHPGCANHCCDAFLYLWRWVFHHYWERKEVGPEAGTPEWGKLEDQKQFKKAVEQRKKMESGDWWEEYEHGLDELDCETIDFLGFLGE
jgi:hypothetical protein